MADDTLPLFPYDPHNKQQPPTLALCAQCRHSFALPWSKSTQRFCSRACVDRHRRGSMEMRFWSSLKKTETCWLWEGLISHAGYGRMKGHYQGRKQDMRAHRYAYLLLVGPIPEGMTLDHLCRVRHCVNPEHLEVVTPVENMLRGESSVAVNKRKTHCLHGHLLAGDNLYLKPHGRRACKTCMRRRGREHEQRQKARGIRRTYARKITQATGDDGH